MRTSLDRRNSSESSSAAEEGEATPLLAELNETEEVGKWYQGPLFIAGARFSVLLVVFSALVGATFWFGMPPLDPSVRSFEWVNPKY